MGPKSRKVRQIGKSGVERLNELENNFNAVQKKKQQETLTKKRSQKNPYSDVWEVIMKPENAIDSDILVTKLIELGLSQSDQLQHLKEQDVKDIAAMLKMIPKREFVSKFEAAVSISPDEDPSTMKQAAVSISPDEDPSRMKQAVVSISPDEDPSRIKQAAVSKIALPKELVYRTYDGEEITYPIYYEFNGRMFMISDTKFEENEFKISLIDSDDEETDCRIVYYLYKQDDDNDDVFLYSFDCNRKGMGRFTLNALLNYLTDPSQPKVISGVKYNFNDETEVGLKASATWGNDLPGKGKHEWSKAQRSLVNYYLKAGFVPTEPIDIDNTDPLPIPLQMNGKIGIIKHRINNYEAHSSASIGGRMKLTKKKRTRRKLRKIRKTRKTMRRR